MVPSSSRPSIRFLMVMGVLALAGGFACWRAARSGPQAEVETGADAPLKAGTAGATLDKTGAVRRSSESAADGRGTVVEPDAQAGKGSPAGVNEALIRQLNTALDEPDIDARTAKWNALLAGMRPQDAKAVRGIFLQNDERGRWFIPEWVSFWKKYGEVDAAAALDEWQASGTPTDPESPGRIVAAGIKARGMEEAKMLLARNDVKASPKLMKDLVKAVARLAPEQSMDFMMKSVPEEFHNVAAQAIVEAGIDRGGLEQVSQLMETLKASGAGEESLQAASFAIFDAALRGGTERAQDFALKNVGRPWVTERSLAALTSEVTNRDIGAGMDFINKLPADLAGYSIELAVNQSTRQNPDGIGLWLREHGAATHYDSITAAYCRTIQAVDPSAAEAWAQTIKDPTLREKALPAVKE